MRFCVSFNLKTEDFPSDYRPLILSLFKHALSNYEDGKYFENYYGIGKTKPFCFSVWLGKSKFMKEKITIPYKRIKLYWSTCHLETGIIFYNALAQLKHHPYPLPFGNAMTLGKIHMEREEMILSREAEIVFVSPLCVREHQKESNQDRYYSYEAENFIEHMQTVLNYQLSEETNLSLHLLDDFRLDPLDCRKTIIRHHHQMIEATIGTFFMQGDLQLLNYFYQAGIASRRSAGFGYFNVVKQGR